MLTAMLGWMFEAVWHALLGLVLLSGLFFGSILVIAREISRANNHDQATCDCLGCNDRRNRAWEKRLRADDTVQRLLNRPEPKPRKVTGSWISTLELKPLDRVEAKGVVYQIISVDRTETGYNVRLRSAKRVSTTPISKNNASRKFWHVI